MAGGVLRFMASYLERPFGYVECIEDEVKKVVQEHVYKDGYWTEAGPGSMGALGGSVTLSNVQMESLSMLYFTSSVYVRGYPAILVDTFKLLDSVAKGTDGLGLKLVLKNPPDDVISKEDAAVQGP